MPVVIQIFAGVVVGFVAAWFLGRAALQAQIDQAHQKLVDARAAMSELIRQGQALREECSKIRQDVAVAQQQIRRMSER